MWQNFRDNIAFGSLVVECSEMARGISWCSIVHVVRTTNDVAHLIARNSHFNLNPYTWFEPPEFMDGLLDSFCTLCSANNMS